VVYQVLYSFISILSLSGNQVLLQQSREAYQVLEFLEMFLTQDPTQLTKKLKKISTQPKPTHPNSWVDPTHGQLWYKLLYSAYVLRRLCTAL